MLHSDGSTADGIYNSTVTEIIPSNTIITKQFVPSPQCDGNTFNCAK